MSNHRLPLLFAVLLVASSAFAEEPRSFRLATKSLRPVQRVEMPWIDAELLRSVEDENAKNVRVPQPERFAVPVESAFTLDESGTWQQLADGRLWRLHIYSPGAMSHNLALTTFELPKGAKLWLYDSARVQVFGPYTASDRAADGSLWTPVIDGDEVFVELFVPDGAARPRLTVGVVNQGFRSFYGTKDTLGQPSGTCMIDVTCPKGAPWQDQSRAVAAYTVNGAVRCTGTMLNNTARDSKPYFLSANHCTFNTAQAATVVTYWNFQSPTCGAAHGTGSTANTTVGGVNIRATSARSDFLLMELVQKPNPAYGVFYAGWDATGTPPPRTFSIHHPRGDVKAITFSKGAPWITTYGGRTEVPNGTHWRPMWGLGVTEGGSSGSCLFDGMNGRCIGQLHGGPSFCGAPPDQLNDFYGRISVSWEGDGTPQTRLRDWLDPTNSGQLTLDGMQQN